MYGTYDLFYAETGDSSYVATQVGDEGDAVGIAMGDYDADGDFDLYVVNQTWRSVLWRNDLDKDSTQSNAAIVKKLRSPTVQHRCQALATALCNSRVCLAEAKEDILLIFLGFLAVKCFARMGIKTEPGRTQCLDRLLMLAKLALARTKQAPSDSYRLLVS